MKRLKVMKSSFIMAVFIFLMTASFSNACWMYLEPGDLVKADTIIVGVVEGKTGEVEKERFNEIAWRVQVKYYLKGTGEEAYITVTTPPENVSTHYSLDTGGNEVLLFLTEQEGYFTPLSPQAVVPIAFNEISSTNITSGEALLEEITILEDTIEEAYRNELTKLLKEFSVRGVETVEKEAVVGKSAPQEGDFKLAYLSLPGALLAVGLWAVLKK